MAADLVANRRLVVHRPSTAGIVDAAKIALFAKTLRPPITDIDEAQFNALHKRAAKENETVLNG